MYPRIMKASNPPLSVVVVGKSVPAAAPIPCPVLSARPAVNQTCPSTFSRRLFLRARPVRIWIATFSRVKSHPFPTSAIMFSNLRFPSPSRSFWTAPSVTSPRVSAPRARALVVLRSNARLRHSVLRARRAPVRSARRPWSSVRPSRLRAVTGSGPSLRP